MGRCKAAARYAREDLRSVRLDRWVQTLARTCRLLTDSELGYWTHLQRLLLSLFIRTFWNLRVCPNNFVLSFRYWHYFVQTRDFRCRVRRALRWSTCWWVPHLLIRISWSGENVNGYKNHGIW